MIEQINELIGETNSKILGEIYTGIFYSCFANTNVSGFFQRLNAFEINKVFKNTCVDLQVIVTSDFDEGLPDRLRDSVKFYELLDLAGGNHSTAKISPIIQFKISPRNFLEVDQWLASLSKISIGVWIFSGLVSDEQLEKTFSVENLKIIENYQVSNLSVAKTASGSVVDVSVKTPTSFTVTLSDWIVEALSKGYLKLSVIDKLHCSRDLLPVLV